MHRDTQMCVWKVWLKTRGVGMKKGAHTCTYKQGLSYKVVGLETPSCLCELPAGEQRGRSQPPEPRRPAARAHPAPRHPQVLAQSGGGGHPLVLPAKRCLFPHLSPAPSRLSRAHLEII